MIGKSNKSSYDNPLAFPVPPQRIQTESPVVNNNTQNIYSNAAGGAAPNPGGILKSNFSSTENPLANFAYQSNSSNNNNNNNSHVQQDSNSYNSENQPETPRKLPLDSYKKDSHQSYNQSGVYMSSTSYSVPEKQVQFATEPPSQNPQVTYYQDSYPQQYQPLPPIQSQYNQPDPYSFDVNNYNRGPVTPVQQQHQQFSPRYNSPSFNQNAAKNESLYERNEREFKVLLQEKSNLKKELDSTGQYPFGRKPRSDHKNFYETETSSNYVYQTPYAKSNDEPHMRLTKDKMIEKPNSLLDDVPSYDPIKHRAGYHQGFDYDPVSKSAYFFKYFEFILFYKPLFKMFFFSGASRVVVLLLSIHKQVKSSPRNRVRYGSTRSA
jgi:hypothetical protein